MYSADGRDAVRYKLTDKGPRIYSAGDGKRDFGIGAEP